MTKQLTLLMAQINPTVGAIAANVEKVITIILQHQDQHDVILFPELVITGYPPEDLLLRPALHDQVIAGLQRIAAVTHNCHIIVGHPSLIEGQFFNSASIYHKGGRIAFYHKHQLPNYGVFDEARYFDPGEKQLCILRINGYQFGIGICEDIWYGDLINLAVAAGLDGLLCLNASPFDFLKHTIRDDLLRKHAEQGIHIVYVNLIGGQDELIFDGQSLALNKSGEICARLPAFTEQLQTLYFKDDQLKSDIAPLLTQQELIYQALVLGTRDYVQKNGFPGVLLGLSGGIDSALTLAVAADALGADKVHAVMMPSRYTAQMSGEDALMQVQAMNVSSSVLAIEPVFDVLLKTLEPAFSGYAPDITEENIQARIRGLLLMALSNKTGKMVLTTSNKSETAVGYATLYGDMAGGFAVLKDVLKTQVYELARYRNSLSAVIPERVLTRPPSAELAENQTDQDSLPDYNVLDSIIVAYMEENKSTSEIIAQGHPAATVARVIRLIKRSEFKRRQAAPGIKISVRAFGRDWRLPITSGFEEPET